jgi:hypothetical protein
VSALPAILDVRIEVDAGGTARRRVRAARRAAIVDDWRTSGTHHRATGTDDLHATGTDDLHATGTCRGGSSIS